MSLPYFPLYPTDFEADTSHLTLAEDGAYNRLLRLMWMTPGCSLPSDDAWIMRRMKATTDAEQCAVRVVLDEFFTTKDGRVSNARLTKEWLAANEAHDKRVSAGRKGGIRKGLKTNANAPSNAKAKPKQPEPEPEPYKKPSNEGYTSARTDCVSTLEEVANPQAVASFLAYRSKSRHKALTLTGAKRLASQLKLISQAGRDPSDALGEAEERGWSTVKAEWILKENPNGNRNNNGGRQSARPSPHSALFASFGAGTDQHDAGSPEHFGEMRDVTPTGQEGLDSGPGGNTSKPLLRVFDGRG